jgi:uracil-DNA glycosylase
MTGDWAPLAAEIAACRICAASLPLGPKPVFAGSNAARLLLISQAPGRRAHLSGIPFSDASGKRLRAWLGLSDAAFYDPRRVAIMPMGFCFPGSAGSGDKLPNPICAATWHQRLRAALPQIGLTLLVGGLAQRAYLPEVATVTEAVGQARQGFGDIVALPHPSWHNNRWLIENPWFEDEILPPLRRRIAALTA